MLSRSIVILGFVALGVAANIYMLSQQNRKTNQLITEEGSVEEVMEQELIPKPNPENLRAHMVYCVSPWGQIVPVFFTAEQWQMLHQVVEMSGQDIDELICEIAVARYGMHDTSNPFDSGEDF